MTDATRDVRSRDRVAVLLAAGLGTRLFPLTLETPKILVPIAGVPLLQHQLRYLERLGFSRVVVNVHHHADKVTAWLNEEWRGHHLKVVVSREKRLLGTAGALLQMSAHLAEPFTVLYGDVVATTHVETLQALRDERHALAALGYQEGTSAGDKGVLRVRGDEVVEFVEKPPGRLDQVPISIGIYACSPELLRYVGEGDDFGRDVWPRVLQAGQGLAAGVVSGPIVDVGTPAGRAQAAAVVTGTEWPDATRGPGPAR